jgi:hypothetical protein
MLLVLLVTACSGAGEGADETATATGSAADAPATADTGSPQAVASPPDPQPSQPAQSPSGAASPGPLQPSEGFDTATLTLSSGEERIQMPVWVADEPDLRQRGLMERTALPQDAGMLFVFPDTTDGGFWMKNTLIPLSIAFIGDDGRIVETLDMQPCEADPCEVYAPGSPYRYALEANLGFFDRHGVGSGWTVDVDDAVEAR